MVQGLRGTEKELGGPTQNLGSLKYLQWLISGATSDLPSCALSDGGSCKEVDFDL